MERLEVVDEPRKKWELRYVIPTLPRSGDVVATLRKAVVERGDFRVGPVDLQIAYGDRVAIVGPNGGGKSTLLDLILGRRAPSAGSATVGSNVVIGQIDQQRTEIVSDAGLLASFCAATGLERGPARTLLAKFALGSEHLDRPGSTLSPGERTRASMAILMANGANLLALDEPTNHLDLEAIEQLEEALDSFAGTVVLITHDRELLASVTFNRTFEVVAGEVNERDPISLGVVSKYQP